MTTYVLCHGAWGGGWGWARVARILRDAGHEVFTPTYTGLGERSHLLSPDVDLETHIQDVRGVIRYEDLRDFVLVGHSYGGMVITGVADKEWEKISKLVYLDAFLPRDGQCLNDMSGPERARAMVDLANERGEGWKVPRPDGSISADLPEEDRKWLWDLTGMQPLATMTQKLRLENNHLKIRDKVYVLASEYIGSPFHQFAEWTRGQDDWRTFELPTHHHLLQSMPAETADILMGRNER